MTKQKLLNIISSGIDCNILSILQIADMEGLKGLENNTKALGWITLAKHKLLLNENGTLTPYGAVTLENIRWRDEVKTENIEAPSATQDIIKTLENKPAEEVQISEDNPEDLPFSQYCEVLQKKLKERMKALTGKENVYLDSNKYLIPSVKVIEKRLIDAMKLYKFKIDERVLKVLLQHIDHCYKANFFKVRTVEYYILGQNSKGSDLDTGIDNYVEPGTKDEPSNNNQSNTEGVYFG